MRLSLILAVAAFNLFAAGTQAASITESFAYSTYQKEVGTPTAFTPFDKTLGSLLSVQATLLNTTTTRVLVSNLSPTTPTGLFNVNATDLINIEIHGQTVPNILGSSVRVTRGGQNDLTQEFSLAAGQSAYATLTSHEVYNIPLDVAFVSGPGNGALYVNEFTIRTSASFSDAPVMVAGAGANRPTDPVYTWAEGSLQITYEYNPTTTDVPEPASLLMLGMGAATTAVLRRRAASKA